MQGLKSLQPNLLFKHAHLTAHRCDLIRDEGWWGSVDGGWSLLLRSSYFPLKSIINRRHIGWTWAHKSTRIFKSQLPPLPVRPDQMFVCQHWNLISTRTWDVWDTKCSKEILSVLVLGSSKCSLAPCASLKINDSFWQWALPKLADTQQQACTFSRARGSFLTPWGYFFLIREEILGKIHHVSSAEV